MPRGNRTGPWGLGPMTGRRLGYCAGYSSPGYTKGPGMGWGRGFGYGRGWRRRGWGYGTRIYPYPEDYPLEVPFSAFPLSSDNESKYLEETLKAMKKEMKKIEKRLAELSEESKE